MTPYERQRLAEIREIYAKHLFEEAEIRIAGQDPRVVMRWVPSETEAVLLLRIIAELERT